MTIRVRFAPSPTGYLHIGGARTALYNWLFARHHKGTFILRIEDTDEVRSTPEAVTAILDGMQWLGLDWDEGPVVNPDGTIGSNGAYGPYFQMERKALYLEYAHKLVAQGHAYYCYCSTEELEARRKQAFAEGKPPKYDGRCRMLTEAQRAAYEQEGKKPVIRFKNDFVGKTVFHDIVKGDISFDNDLLDDFVIVKSSGVPVYNFAVMIDDHCMNISHIIRGDDHISNTPRQILLYQSFGWEIPQFAHIPMILGQDGARLSKRHGATSVTAYRDEGFLSEALVNYLALLGWSTEDSQQLFAHDELIEKFRLERCGASASIFDQHKLLWMNGEYIRKKDSDAFYQLVKPLLVAKGLVTANATPEQEQYARTVVALEQEKAKQLTDVPALVDFMLRKDIVYDEEAVKKVFGNEGARAVLEGMEAQLALVPDDAFTPEKLEELTRAYATQHAIKTGQVFHPLRVATSGRTQGPSLFHYMAVLGKQEVLRRVGKIKCILRLRSGQVMQNEM